MIKQTTKTKQNNTKSPQCTQHKKTWRKATKEQQTTPSVDTKTTSICKIVSQPTNSSQLTRLFSSTFAMSKILLAMSNEDSLVLQKSAPLDTSNVLGEWCWVQNTLFSCCTSKLRLSWPLKWLEQWPIISSDMSTPKTFPGLPSFPRTPCLER